MRTRHVTTLSAFFLVMWLVGGALQAEPAKPIKPPVGMAKKADPPPPPAKLMGACQFGEVVQTGSEFVIQGGSWVATGRIRKDGRVQVLWVYQGDAAPALYDIVGGELVGRWGYARNGARFDEDGELLDAGSPETLRETGDK